MVEKETFDLVIISFSLITLVINLILVNKTLKLRQRIKGNQIKTHQLLCHIRKQQSIRKSLKQKQALLEATINQGATAVENIHQSISDTAFNVMETLSSTTQKKSRSRKLRTIHNHTSNGIYKSVKVVNKQVGVLTNTVLSTSKQKTKSDKSVNKD